ncbi:uncharacterized protein LOC141884109 [Acropora palmata]|uniref:uncharacterized protein LOC141884109 n=1 Tax=Acropora palmata TaxID=6131 RepID=UPI003DA153A1
MMSSKSDPRQIYDDLKDRLSKVFKTLKTLEARASKPNFSTEELSSRNCMTAAFKGHKVGECDVADEIDGFENTTGNPKAKNSKESTVQGAAVGRKRKSKKCLHFGKLEKDITSYKSMIGDILAEADAVSQTRRFGAVVLEERKIPRSKEEKTKQDLISIISRWNALSKEVFNTSQSIDAFVAEVQMEYSKLRLWNENAEVADSLLMEYHASHADKPEKLGTTIRAVRMQLHENQAVLENFRKAKPRLYNMRDISVALMRSGRLEEPDADELERVINILVAKYESIDNRLNASRDRIYAEINRLRQRMVKQGSSSILRRFSSKRNSSFRRKSSIRKKPAIQQRKKTENKNLQVKKESEVVNSSTSTDFNTSMETTLVFQTTDKEYKEEKSRFLQQKDVLERFDFSFKSTEKTVADFEVKSIQKFSDVGPNVDEPKRQLSDLMRFESDMKKPMSEFQSELERLQKAKQEGLFNYTDNEGLEKKWNCLKTRWNTLWKEHLENRNRLCQELALFDQRQEDKAFMVKKETVRISDDYSLLSQTLDDLQNTEYEPSVRNSPPEMKIMNNFDMMVQSINKWMTESEDLVNSLQSRLNSGEFKKRILKITERWEEMDKIETNINDVNRLGQDISNDSITMETKERIKKKLEALNTRWRETKKILKECIDKEDKEPIGYRGCCSFQIVPRVFHACFYN